MGCPTWRWPINLVEVVFFLNLLWNGRIRHVLIRHGVAVFFNFLQLARGLGSEDGMDLAAGHQLLGLAIM